MPTNSKTNQQPANSPVLKRLNTLLEWPLSDELKTASIDLLRSLRQKYAKSSITHKKEIDKIAQVLAICLTRLHDQRKNQDTNQYYLQYLMKCLEPFTGIKTISTAILKQLATEYDLLSIPVHRVTNRDNLHNITDCVIRGGGIRTLGYPKTIEILKETGQFKELKRIGGSSAGAIMATLVAFNLDKEKIEQLTMKLQPKLRYEQFKTVILQHVKELIINKSSDIENLLTDVEKSRIYEILASSMLRISDIPQVVSPHDGTSLIYSNSTDFSGESTFEERLPETPITFNDLTIIKKLYFDSPEIIGNLFITGTLLSNPAKTMYFDSNNTPNLEIAKALEISTALPPVLNKVRLGSDIPVTEEYRGTYIDGGLMANCPVAYALNEKYQGQNQVLAITIHKTDKFTPESSELNIIRDKFAGYYGANRRVERLRAEKIVNEGRAEGKVHFLTLPVDDVKSHQFDLSDEKKGKLINNAGLATESWLNRKAHTRARFEKLFNDLIIGNEDKSSKLTKYCTPEFKSIFLAIIRKKAESLDKKGIQEFLIQVKDSAIYTIFSIHQKELSQLIPKRTSSQKEFDGLCKHYGVDTSSKRLTDDLSILPPVIL